MSDKQDIWFVVINAYAASSCASSKWTKAEALLKAKNVVYHQNRTGKSGNAMEISFDACMAGYRKFVAAGGDGTVHDVLNGIGAFIEWAQQSGRHVDFSDFTLGVLPLGSGNDWIKSLGNPRSLSECVEVLAKGKARTQDVVMAKLLDYDSELEVGRSYMANIGGVGIDARVCELVNAKKKLGKRGKILYVTSLIKAIRNRVPAYAKVICDGNLVFDGAYLSMAFGTGKYSGGGMRQTPEAVMDDGLLDLTVIPDLPIMRIAREVPRLFTGSFLKVRELVVAKSKVITVIPYDKAQMEPVEVDGEVVGKAPVRFEVLGSRINVAVAE